MLGAEPMLCDREAILQTAGDRVQELPVLRKGVARVLVGLDPERAAEEILLPETPVMGHAEQIVESTAVAAFAMLVEEPAGEIGDDDAAGLAEFADAPGLGVG